MNKGYHILILSVKSIVKGSLESKIKAIDKYDVGIYNGLKFKASRFEKRGKFLCANDLQFQLR